ncbi:sigma-70 family RNA polymerase sigma factor [Cytobacillus sp. FSL W8-0315]|uniref:sigma-70 family RNA polymerase sigma factor n=1 Tax=Cytobacillus sp. FSL W8-0315 TaxID=2921600 RepID=UPI0030F8673F
MDNLCAKSTNEELCRESEIKKIKKRLPEILRNSVIKEFLVDESNNDTFCEFLSNPNLNNKKALDQNFKDFYRYNRVIRYMTGLIKRYSIDYDKKVTLRNNRFPLIINKPINGKDYSPMSMTEIISDNKQPSLESLILRKEEFLYTENELLYKALKKLTNKQLMILFLYYEQGFNNKEISCIFNQTEQNISYWHKKTLKQLKESIENFQSEGFNEKK